MNLFEKKIVGGILSGAVAASAVNISAADMPDLGEVLRVCLDLEAQKTPITPDLLALRLSEFEGFYSADDFSAMARTATSAAVVFEAVDKVKSSALQAYLKREINDLAADDKSGIQILDTLKAIVAKADRDYRTSENNFVFLSEIVGKLEAVYDDLYNGVSYSVPTGFPIIDHEILDGFSKGDLHVIVGFTGQGKSALALNCAMNQANQGVVVGVVSREMSDVENGMRLQSSVQNIPRWKISKGMFDKTYDELKRGLKELGQKRIAFDIRTDDIDSLRIQTRRMVEQFDLKILYVDYLQLMQSNNPSTRAEDVGAVSRGLKLIAMENNIPVVALSQFNRGATNASVYDLLSHLKESSGIEQDASTVLYIQLEKTEENKPIKEAMLHVLKNRNGATFRPINLYYHGATFTFSQEWIEI